MKKFRAVAIATAFALTSQFALIAPANAGNIWPCLDALSGFEAALTFLYGERFAQRVTNDMAVECMVRRILT